MSRFAPLLLLIALLACVQLTAGAAIASIGFYTDAACTVPANSTQTGIATNSYTQWTSLPYNGVYDLQSPPCFNDTIPGVQSGQYECLSNYSSQLGGLLVTEYAQPNCAGTPLQIFEFLGAANATCFSGFIEVPAVNGPPAMNFLFAKVVCTNTTATVTVTSSSSSSTGSQSGSGSTSTGTGTQPIIPGNGATANNGAVLSCAVLLLSLAALLTL
jgi:hypothetical protein